MSRRAWTAAEERRFEKLWLAGVSLRDISAQTGRTIDALVYRRAWLKLPVRLHALRRYGPPRGEASSGCKLTTDDVRAIRATVGKTQREIAAEYGLTRCHVGQIIRRRYWSHV